MTTNKLIKAAKGVALGLAMATTTVFQASGCTMGADSITSMTSLLDSALQNSDVSFSFSSSPHSSVASNSSRSSDYGTFNYCDCNYGF